VCKKKIGKQLVFSLSRDPRALSIIHWINIAQKNIKANKSRHEKITKQSLLNLKKCNILSTRSNKCCCT
jgi:hypothetical protein